MLDAGGQVRATQLISQNSGGLDAPRKPFRIESAEPTSILKSNAFEVECPSEVLAFEMKEWPKEHVWKWVREQTAKKPVVAVPFKSQVFALGTVDDIRTCFGDNIKDRPQRAPISEDSLRFEDGAITSLMREALIRSMVLATGLEADSAHGLWSPESPRDEKLDGESFSVY